MSESPVPSLLLLCVDVQPVFLKAMSDPAALTRRSAFAVAAARGLGLDVVFTEQVPAKLGGTLPEIRALAPDAPVFGKDTFSAFGDDAIRAALLDGKREHLLLCGLETPVCVYQTALDARAAGLEVTLLSDAIDARRPADAHAAIEALIRAGVHVLPSETVFYALLRDVKHPFFKAYTQLVKAHG